MKEYICLDVGGTEIKTACVDEAGNLMQPVRHFPARAGENAENLLAHFAEIIRETKPAPEQSAGIRLAFPGPFDYERGICLMQGLAKYDALYGLDLRRELGTRLGVGPEDIRFANDASAFALGEMGFGGGSRGARLLPGVRSAASERADPISGRLPAGNHLPGRADHEERSILSGSAGGRVCRAGNPDCGYGKHLPSHHAGPDKNISGTFLP